MPPTYNISAYLKVSIIAARLDMQPDTIALIGKRQGGMSADGKGLECGDGKIKQRSRSRSPLEKGKITTAVSYPASCSSPSLTEHLDQGRNKNKDYSDNKKGDTKSISLFASIKGKFAKHGLDIIDDAVCERLRMFLLDEMSGSDDLDARLSLIFDDIQERIENKILKTQIISIEVIDDILSQIPSLVDVNQSQSKQLIRQDDANFVKKFQPKRQPKDASSPQNVFEVYETPAVLLVTIVSAIGLPPIADGKTCNPKVKVLHDSSKFMTTSKSKTTKPIWNESFTCVYKPGKDLTLSVYNEVPFSRNTLIGDVVIPLRLEGARKLQFSGWNDIVQRKVWSVLDIGRTIVTATKYGHLGQVFVAVSVVMGELKGHVYVNYQTGLTRALQGDEPSGTEIDKDDDGDNGHDTEVYEELEESKVDESAIDIDKTSSTVLDPMEMMNTLKISVGNDLLELNVGETGLNYQELMEDISEEDDEEDSDDDDHNALESGKEGGIDEMLIDEKTAFDDLMIDDQYNVVSSSNDSGAENLFETEQNHNKTYPQSPSKISRRQSLTVNQAAVGNDEEFQAGKFQKENEEFVDSKVQINETYWKKLEEKGFESSKGPTSSAVKVAVRIRLADSDGSNKPIVKLCNENEILVEHTSSNSMSHQYAFDVCFDSNDPVHGKGEQTDIYDALGVDILHHVWSGYNACLFAYGQTGSGKSYSIMGTKEQPGIIPRLADSLFYFISNHPQGFNYTVHSSFLEIYNETVRDLLDHTRTTNLKVREHPETGVFVEGLSIFKVKDFSDINTLLQVGLKERVTESTGMNNESSRSHAIFTINVKCENPETQSSKLSKISIVDLAGSERVGSAKSSGLRLQEGAAINKSLSTLGRCIMQISALSARASSRRQSLGTSSKHVRIPFRDSILTWMLKESLSGNSKTTMLATISPNASNYAETLSTLRYAASASQIKTKAIVNEDPTTKLIASLNKEVKELRSLLEKSQSSNSIVGSAESVDKLIMKTIIRRESKARKKSKAMKREKNRRRGKSLRTFSILEQIDNHKNVNLEQPYIISMQDYSDGHDEDNSIYGDRDTTLGVENDDAIVTTVTKRKENRYLCKYKFYLPLGRSIKIGGDRQLMEKQEIDIKIYGGHDTIFPVHCSFTYEVDSGGIKRIFLRKENEDAMLFVNGAALTSSIDGMKENLEIKRNDVIGLGRFHNFIVY